MRKLLFLLFIPALILAACEKKEYTNPNRTIFSDLGPGLWQTDNGRTYSAIINMPEIDSYFNDYGAVLVYLSFDGRSYEQIPEVYKGISYSFIHQKGQIVVQIQSSDYSAITPPSGTVTVKVVLIDSN